jgi:hypothetical protein
MSAAAAIYARYSSDLQREASIEDQNRICRERAAREGWSVYKYYSDHGISGASLSGPVAKHRIPAHDLAYQPILGRRSGRAD